MSRSPLAPIGRRARGVVRRAVSVLLVAGGLVGGAAAPAAACSSMAPTLHEVAVSAHVIVRAEIAAVRGRPSDRRYDLRVLDVLKGKAPAVIRGFEARGEVRGGVCDGGWGGRPGAPVFLFLGTTEVEGTPYHPRLSGADWSRMNDGVITRSTTAAGVMVEIREVIPTRRALVPDRLFLADAVEGDRAVPPRGITDADVQVRLLHHRDGQLSVRTWRLGGRRVDHFVIRAGDLERPGPVLFRMAADNDEYQAWAEGPARDAFRPSAAARSLRKALARLDAGEAMIEIWTRDSTVPRFHGLLRPVPMPTVTFSAGRRVTVRPVLPAIARSTLRDAAWIPLLALPIETSFVRRDLR